MPHPLKSPSNRDVGPPFALSDSIANDVARLPASEQGALPTANRDLIWNRPIGWKKASPASASEYANQVLDRPPIAEPPESFCGCQTHARMLVSKRGNEGPNGVRPAHRTKGQRSVPAHPPRHRVFQGIDQP